jgi:DNA-directed RNA polymerase subunit RPC12/RpoP
MDIIFNCPECEQELAVDNSGAGSEIECPSCGGTIVIPEPPAPPVGAPPAPTTTSGAHQPINAIASSAAAKVEMHLKVPINKDKPMASLISKPPLPLEAAAKETDKKTRVKTIRHTDCIEVGHDRFDEMISNFLNKVGEANIISVTPLTYTNLDIGTQKLMTEYAVMIVYRG